MASRECPTCCEDYDMDDHRVRILNCGHAQCTRCMRAQFSNGRITCASCRTTHTYSNFNSIPICYIAENLLGEKDIAPKAPRLNQGVCAEHDTYKLFWCDTHQEWICIHCSLINHPRGDCNILPIKNKFEIDKDLIITNISEEIKILSTTDEEIVKQTEEEKYQIKKNKEEIDKLKSLIHQKEMDVDIINARLPKLDELRQERKIKKSALESLMTTFSDVNNFIELELENDKCISVINSHKNWRQELDEYNQILLNENKIQENLEMIKNTAITSEKRTMIQETKKILHQTAKQRNIFAMKNIGNTNYYSLLEKRDGCILLNNLQHNFSPVAHSLVLEFDDILGLIQGVPVAFLTIANNNTTFGRIHIRLDGPHRRVHQFMELSTGSSGRGSYRTARFDDGIECKGQPEEAVRCGGYINTVGVRECKALYHLETGPAGDCLDEGVVYVYQSDQSAGFAICTRAQHSEILIWPAIGHVIAGLPQLKAAIEDYNATDIVFSKCGVVIDEII